MKKLLVIGYVWPEPGSSAAGSRMIQLLKFFLSEGYSITFATTAQKSDFAANLSALGIASEKIELNNESFDLFIKNLMPDVVLFDRYMMEEQFGWRVSEACPKAVKILDTEDLHFFRKARQESFKKGLEMNTQLLQSDLAKREVASIYRCDLSLIISKVEMELLQETFQVPEELLCYLPFMQKNPTEEERIALPSFEQRDHFISIGNFLHEPNWDAVLNLKQNIWPLIRRELPEAEMHIYGAYPSEKVFQLHNDKEGFLIRGRATSAMEVVKQAKVLLAPLRFGAGLKGKFIDAMFAGTPAVTTTIGAEGMAGDLPWNGVLANDPEEFAGAAVDLYRSKEKWKQSQENGFRIVRENFSAEIHEKGFRKRINDLVQDLQQHREQNFTGAMLTQHRVNSVRYLSKYIELKNRLKT